MRDHEKKRLPRDLELEKRRYIGFRRTPVIDDKDHYPGGVDPAVGDPWQRYTPWYERPRFDA